MLQYNKLYQSLKKVSAEWHAGHVQWAYCWNYFRFYEDGVFIYASIQGNNIEDISKSFTRNSPNSTTGKFKLNNTTITFIFDTVEITGSITHENNLIIEGKLAWDMYYPMP